MGRVLKTIFCRQVSDNHILIRGWALINFSYLQGGRLFEVGAYSRLGA